MQSSFVFAFETDQYNLSPVSLADIGGEVTDYAEQNVRKAFEKTNAEIAEHQNCLEKKSSGCDAPEKEKATLEKLRSEDKITREVFDLLGGGIVPFTNAGTFMDKHQFKAQPPRYKSSFGKSIFKRYPTDYLTISPTVKIYDAEFGTDKVAHFYQQGYSYYKIYKRAVAEGVSADEATKKAVKWGRKTERTYYGTLTSGVYSNADLCSNYAGLRFYQNLTGEIKISGEIRPPLLVLKNGFWAFNDAVDLRTNLVKAFFSEHFNEALNPSVYTNFIGFRTSVRRIVRDDDCPQWRERFGELTSVDFKNKTDSLKLWNGEDYGYTDSRNFITIAAACFDESPRLAQNN